MRVPEEGQATRQTGFRIGASPVVHIQVGMAEAACGETQGKRIATFYPNHWPGPRCPKCVIAMEVPEYVKNEVMSQELLNV